MRKVFGVITIPFYIYFGTFLLLQLLSLSICSGRLVNRNSVHLVVNDFYRHIFLFFPRCLFELQIIAKRFDYNMAWPIATVRKLLSRENQLFLAHSEPWIRCPFEKGAYKIPNGTVDFDYVAHFSLDT